MSGFVLCLLPLTQISCPFADFTERSRWWTKPSKANDGLPELPDDFWLAVISHLSAMPEAVMLQQHQPCPLVRLAGTCRHMRALVLGNAAKRVCVEARSHGPTAQSPWDDARTLQGLLRSASAAHAVTVGYGFGERCDLNRWGSAAEGSNRQVQHSGAARRKLCPLTTVRVIRIG